MTDDSYQNYDYYSPNERVEKRLNRIDVDTEKVSHQEILAILENEEIWDEESALTKNDVKHIAEKIEKYHEFRDNPSSRTIKNRLDELKKTDIVNKNTSSSPHEYWKTKDEDVHPIYYWYIKILLRKIHPYAKRITYPHTISSVVVIIYIIITLPSAIRSVDGWMLVFLIGLYFLGYVMSYYDEMKFD